MHRQTIKSFEKLKNDRFDQIYWIHIREKYDVAGAVNPLHDLCIRIWDHLPKVGRHAKYQVLCCMILACEHAVEKRQEKVFRCPIWLWWSGDAFSFHIIVRSDHWSLVFDNWQLHFDLILHHMLRRISLHDSALNPGCSRLPRYWQLTSSLELMVLI